MNIELFAILHFSGSGVLATELQEKCFVNGTIISIPYYYQRPQDSMDFSANIFIAAA